MKVRVVRQPAAEFADYGKRLRIVIRQLDGDSIAVERVPTRGSHEEGTPDDKPTILGVEMQIRLPRAERGPEFPFKKFSRPPPVEAPTRSQAKA